ncbi:hypothetical protein DV096_00840 [Bradymonadaceae bacterium TMQ3]|uniref:Peptidase C-terminal archaeal/bacterial domain-containing protein n=1 Tax=Lujinxingia sediminis TaxID=2480984 RepID=A0ABY0CYR2_9DELT|nr:hypothetical protein DV096_00840 [Bradymonadaceae bacterium TMQ3]RVU49007.1 hypothetical protein EA187_05085 [Lujinxingia sediminis]TXC78300.1 hypothetical protein FRC91_05050 [Bradymonadales bacterium TMQ1]
MEGDHPHLDDGSVQLLSGLDAPGPDADAIFSVVLAGGKILTATVSNLADATNDMALYLVSDCGDERASYQAASDLPGEGAESVTFTATEAGAYLRPGDGYVDRRR